MTTANGVKPKGKRKTKPKADATEDRPPLFERLMKGFDDLTRHFAGEDVGVTVDVRISPALVGETVAGLKKAREDAGLTIAQVAARSGIRVETLSRLEHGRVPNPTVLTLAKYAFAVGRSLTLGSKPRGG